MLSAATRARGNVPRSSYARSAIVRGYEYTGAGYYLSLQPAEVSLAPATIADPVVVGQGPGFTVGFIVYGSGDRLIIECHSWSEREPPENIRRLNLLIEEHVHCTNLEPSLGRQD